MSQTEDMTAYWASADEEDIGSTRTICVLSTLIYRLWVKDTSPNSSSLLHLFLLH